MNSNYNISKPISRFFGLIKADKSEIINIYIYAIFSGLVNLSLPLGIQAILNLITGGQISTSWFVLIFFVLSGVLISGILQILQQYTTENIQQKIFTRSAFDFTYRIPKLKLDNIDNLYIPELVNRFFDITSVQKGLSKILIDFSSATLQVLFGLILLSLYHSFFIVYSLILILIVILIIRITGKRGFETSMKESSYKYEVVHWLEELARTLETFKLAGKTDLPFIKTDEAVVGYLTNRKDHFRVLVFQNSILIIFKILITAGLLVLGGLLVINQQMNLGQFVAAEIIILLVITSVEKIILSMETIYDVLTSVEKIGVVTDLPIENNSTKECNFTNIENGISISLRNVGYKFSNSKFDVLKDINLEISANEKICIAGYEGSGKSMLLRIISGLYDNYNGTVLLNETPLSNFDKDKLRSVISYSLAKEDTIFNGTLAENISLGRENISFEEIKQAADMFGLLKFHDVFHEGYYTVLNPEGKQLPKSVIIKIMLARTIVNKPKILILEDLLSKFKSQDKENFLNYIFDKNNNMSVIIVSNEKNIAKRCDKIIKMDNGEITSSGTYNEVQNKEWFTVLFNQ
jgi:ABC-type bacteriocin/lantibiotic exporter with double-glycine peptidase domain